MIRSGPPIRVRLVATIVAAAALLASCDKPTGPQAPRRVVPAATDFYMPGLARTQNSVADVPRVPRELVIAYAGGPLRPESERLLRAVLEHSRATPDWPVPIRVVRPDEGATLRWSRDGLILLTLVELEAVDRGEQWAVTAQVALQDMRDLHMTHEEWLTSRPEIGQRYSCRRLQINMHFAVSGVSDRQEAESVALDAAAERILSGLRTRWFDEAELPERSGATAPAPAPPPARFTREADPIPVEVAALLPAGSEVVGCFQPIDWTTADAGDGTAIRQTWTSALVRASPLDVVREIERTVLSRGGTPHRSEGEESAWRKQGNHMEMSLHEGPLRGSLRLYPAGERLATSVDEIPEVAAMIHGFGVLPLEAYPWTVAEVHLCIRLPVPDFEAELGAWIDSERGALSPDSLDVARALARLGRWDEADRWLDAVAVQVDQALETAGLGGVDERRLVCLRLEAQAARASAAMARERYGEAYAQMVTLREMPQLEAFSPSRRESILEGTRYCLADARRRWISSLSGEELSLEAGRSRGEGMAHDIVRRALTLESVAPVRKLSDRGPAERAWVLEALEEAGDSDGQRRELAIEWLAALDPGPDRWAWIARTEARRGRWEDARAWMERADRPTDLALIALGPAWSETVWEDLSARLIEDRGAIETVAALAHGLEHDGRHDAVLVLSRWLADHPGDEWAPTWRDRAIRTLVELGRYDEAVARYRGRTEEKPEDERPWCDLAWALVEAGRPEEALAAAARAIEIREDCGTGHWQLGRALLALERRVEAEEALRKATRQIGRVAEAWADWARALAAVGRIEEAERALRDAERLRAEEWALAWARAAILAARGSRDEALAAVRAAEAARPAAAHLLASDPALRGLR